MSTTEARRRVVTAITLDRVLARFDVNLISVEGFCESQPPLDTPLKIHMTTRSGTVIDDHYVDFLDDTLGIRARVIEAATPINDERSQGFGVQVLIAPHHEAEGYRTAWRSTQAAVYGPFGAQSFDVSLTIPYLHEYSQWLWDFIDETALSETLCDAEIAQFATVFVEDAFASWSAKHSVDDDLSL